MDMPLNILQRKTLSFMLSVTVSYLGLIKDPHIETDCLSLNCSLVINNKENLQGKRRTNRRTELRTIITSAVIY